MKTATVIKHFGSAAATGRALGLSRAAVSKWGETVPPLRAFQLERITDGKLRVTDTEIRKQTAA